MARDIPVRLGSRSAQPPFDWEQPSTWASALEGVGSAYITYYPDLAIPGAADAVSSLADVALEQGVRRLVLLSAAASRRPSALNAPCRRRTPIGPS